MHPDTAGGSGPIPHRGTFPHGEPGKGFASPHVGASGCWGLIEWAWVYRAARRCARRIGSTDYEDLAHDIALGAVLELRAGCPLALAVNRAESRTEQRYTRGGATRGGNVPPVFPGARVTPGQWRSLYAWLRRVVPNARQRAVLEGTLRGESLARVAESLGEPLGRAKVLRSLALATCRRALDRS